MALTHVTLLRNVLADAVDTAINVGTTDTGGDLAIQAAAVDLAVIEFADPAFGPAASAIITMASPPRSNTAVAAGTADSFEIRNRDNTLQISGTVTLTSGGGDIELDNTNITIGQTVEITSLTYTAPV